MPTPKKGPRLGGSPAHQKAILANLATSLFEHGAITTTEAKARVLRPYAEKLITKAKRGDLHNRRQVMSVIRDKGVVHTLFTEIGPRYEERPGGYTRITKLGPRKGDNAPMAVIELVEAEFTAKVRSTKKDQPKTTAAPTTSDAEDRTVDEAVAPDAAEPTESAAAEAPAADQVEEVDEVDATDESQVDATDESQVEAQDAVADQEPAGEMVEPTSEEATDEATDDSKDDSK